MCVWGCVTYVCVYVTRVCNVCVCSSLLGRELIQVSGVANMPSKAVGVWSSMGGGCISTSSGSFLGHTSAGGGGGGQLAGCIGDTEPGGVQTGASGEELIPAQEYIPVKYYQKYVALCRTSLKVTLKQHAVLRV